MGTNVGKRPKGKTRKEVEAAKRRTASRRQNAADQPAEMSVGRVERRRIAREQRKKKYDKAKWAAKDLRVTAVRAREREELTHIRQDWEYDDVIAVHVDHAQRALKAIRRRIRKRNAKFLAVARALESHYDIFAELKSRKQIAYDNKRAAKVRALIVPEERIATMTFDNRRTYPKPTFQYENIAEMLRERYALADPVTERVLEVDGEPATPYR